MISSMKQLPNSSKKRQNLAKSENQALLAFNNTSLLNTKSDGQIFKYQPIFLSQYQRAFSDFRLPPWLHYRAVRVTARF